MPNKKIRNYHSKLFNQSGFTLIELLTVMGIIALIASSAIVAFSSARQSARNSLRLNNIKKISEAMALYYNDNGSFPNTGESWVCLGPSTVSCWLGSYAGSDQIMSDIGFYLSEVPTNMSKPGTYAYNTIMYSLNTGARRVSMIWAYEGTLSLEACKSTFGAISLTESSVAVYPPGSIDGYSYCRAVKNY